ncbi:thiol-disulfide isomerase-like thioredoxin [Rivularia sp. PCC 7116]|uniref:TlpA family protein disulfide reductase n=1 Tax=Rivularia sp. PCC 7116 TaxID=373994 RepID=UPI00029ED8E6|nr:thioredoxin domain-containing protein [Rivularia sp. PCC 7116]AFY56107.1 thiol-disulfide isomerase-like thioredoxin [Rivularia sp. PCC 7116]
MKNFFTQTKTIKALTLAATVGIMTTLAACSNATDNNSASVSEPQTEEVTAASSATQGLAQQLQGKPVVVDIYADWCAGCKKIKPTLEALKKEYGDTANFVVFDVTDKKTTEASEAKAKELGLSDVFAKYKAKTATVAVMNPATGEVVELFQKNQNKADYVAALDTTKQQITN